MQRFKSLQLETGTITSSNLIEAYLFASEHFWLLECEVDNVTIKIENGILYWIEGTFYWGAWKWGVWQSGKFLAGKWNGGIFMSGTFSGEWFKGVWKGGTFKGKDHTGKIINKFDNIVL